MFRKKTRLQHVT